MNEGQIEVEHTAKEPVPIPVLDGRTADNLLIAEIERRLQECFSFLEALKAHKAGERGKE